MYGLSSELIQRFNAVFAQYPQLEKVVIFGSRATGRYRAGSDIDLAMFLKPGQSLDLNRIAQQLDEADAGDEQDDARDHRVRLVALVAV